MEERSGNCVSICGWNKRSKASVLPLKAIQPLPHCLPGAVLLWTRQPDRDTKHRTTSSAANKKEWTHTALIHTSMAYTCQLYLYFTYLQRKFLGPGWCSRFGYSLRAGLSVDRMPVGAEFSAPVHTGSGAQAPSSTMGIGSLPRGWKRVEVYLYFPSGPSWPVTG